MKKLRVSKEFHFEMAHALWKYDGLCRHIHGHSYKLLVTIIGEPIEDTSDQKLGMVLDFSDLKAAVKEPVVDFFDHSLVIYKKAGDYLPEEPNEMYDKVHLFDFQPTAENLVLYIAEKVKRRLPRGVDLYSVRLYETATSFAEWYASDNQ
ncbi:MAG: 6-carboxytetrahydropterin synthase [Candidatus Atribacteria bacterium]|nr:MAG: 6-carboxytetrahydropterin synthase [Candidatus Atribacteria bacterium]